MPKKKGKNNSSLLKNKKTASYEKTKFRIIGIGASAGGLDAIERFLDGLKDASHIALVIIQHLDPDHKGMMPELLQRRTKMKVIQASDGLRIRQNFIYVIPPDSTMSIKNGVLSVKKPKETRGLRLPIDHFFSSLAEDMQENSVGIILSGMGSDGTIGAEEIKKHGGLVLVQEPSSAQYDSMPQSAVNAEAADMVAPPEKLGDMLMGRISQSVDDTQHGETHKSSAYVIEKITALVHEFTGHDFSMYKKTTLLRRLQRRLEVHHLNSLYDYEGFLRDNPGEIKLLFSELLIGVTNFFRDRKAWDILALKILPGIIAAKAGTGELRAWVAGCSTGEEAYTLAMIIREALEKAGAPSGIIVQIFATDIDSDAIEKARKGFFGKNIKTDISEARLKRFFKEENGGYCVKPEIREMVIFAVQNAVKDPPFTRLDIITCRNLLIYMEPNLQKKLLSLFRYSLNKDGILLLGSAETAGDMKAFKTIDFKNRIYRRIDSGQKESITQLAPSFFRASVTGRGYSHENAARSMQDAVSDLMLSTYSPASVLVNQAGDIMYIFGKTGKYLEPASGKTNWNIFAMARDGIREALPVAFRKARQQRKPVKMSGVAVKSEGKKEMTDITVHALTAPSELKGNLLLVFNDVKLPAVNPAFNAGKHGRPLKKNGSMNAMELELKRTRENLSSAVEEMQSSQEELRSANEELQSNNEELQSTNEELTTSKEEMQSLNEELQTLNAELQSKLDAFERVNNDMNNLLNSTEIAVLFLDKQMRISRFTPMATKIFKLIPTDVGRPVTDLVNDLVYPDMIPDMKEVLRTLIFCEKIIKASDGRCFKVRIMPYRTADDHIDGLVVTFIREDHDEKKG